MCISVVIMLDSGHIQFVNQGIPVSALGDSLIIVALECFYILLLVFLYCFNNIIRETYRAEALIINNLQKSGCRLYIFNAKS